MEPDFDSLVFPPGTLQSQEPSPPSGRSPCLMVWPSVSSDDRDRYARGPPSDEEQSVDAGSPMAPLVSLSLRVPITPPAVPSEDGSVAHTGIDDLNITLVSPKDTLMNTTSSTRAARGAKFPDHCAHRRLGGGQPHGRAYCLAATLQVFQLVSFVMLALVLLDVSPGVPSEREISLALVSVGACCSALVLALDLLCWLRRPQAYPAASCSYHRSDTCTSSRGALQRLASFHSSMSHRQSNVDLFGDNESVDLDSGCLTPHEDLMAELMQTAVSLCTASPEDLRGMMDGASRQEKEAVHLIGHLVGRHLFPDLQQNIQVTVTTDTNEDGQLVIPSGVRRDSRASAVFGIVDTFLFGSQRHNTSLAGSRRPSLPKGFNFSRKDTLQSIPTAEGPSVQPTHTNVGSSADIQEEPQATVSRLPSRRNSGHSVASGRSMDNAAMAVRKQSTAGRSCGAESQASSHFSATSFSDFNDRQCSFQLRSSQVEQPNPNPTTLMTPAQELHGWTSEGDDLIRRPGQRAIRRQSTSTSLSLPNQRSSRRSSLSATDSAHGRMLLCAVAQKPAQEIGDIAWGADGVAAGSNEMEDQRRLSSSLAIRYHNRDSARSARSSRKVNCDSKRGSIQSLPMWSKQGGESRGQSFEGVFPRGIRSVGSERRKDRAATCHTIMSGDSDMSLQDLTRRLRPISAGTSARNSRRSSVASGQRSCSMTSRMKSNGSAPSSDWAECARRSSKKSAMSQMSRDSTSGGSNLSKMEPRRHRANTTPNAIPRNFLSIPGVPSVPFLPRRASTSSSRAQSPTCAGAYHRLKNAGMPSYMQQLFEDFSEHERMRQKHEQLLGTKTIDMLALELESGQCTVEEEDGRPVRVVQVCELRIVAAVDDDKTAPVLVQKWRRDTEGRWWRRNALPGTKLRAHETPRDAAERLMSSEFSDFKALLVIPEDMAVESLVEDMQSPSYPGVTSRYLTTIVEVRIRPEVGLKGLGDLGLGVSCSKHLRGTMLLGSQEGHTICDWISPQECSVQGIRITTDVLPTEDERSDVRDSDSEDDQADPENLYRIIRDMNENFSGIKLKQLIKLRSQILDLGLDELGRCLVPQEPVPPPPPVAIPDPGARPSMARMAKTGSLFQMMSSMMGGQRQRNESGDPSENGTESEAGSVSTAVLWQMAMKDICSERRRDLQEKMTNTIQNLEAVSESSSHGPDLDEVYSQAELPPERPTCEPCERGGDVTPRRYGSVTVGGLLSPRGSLRPSPRQSVTGATANLRTPTNGLESPSSASIATDSAKEDIPEGEDAEATKKRKYEERKARRKAVKEEQKSPRGKMSYGAIMRHSYEQFISPQDEVPKETQEASSSSTNAMQQDNGAAARSDNHPVDTRDRSEPPAPSGPARPEESPGMVSSGPVTERPPPPMELDLGEHSAFVKVGEVLTPPLASTALDDEEEARAKHREKRRSRNPVNDAARNDASSIAKAEAALFLTSSSSGPSLGRGGSGRLEGGSRAGGAAEQAEAGGDLDSPRRSFMRQKSRGARLEPLGGVNSRLGGSFGSGCDDALSPPPPPRGEEQGPDDAIPVQPALRPGRDTASIGEPLNDLEDLTMMGTRDELERVIADLDIDSRLPEELL
mmetsp:Transcript_117840/g.334091  ORF Transcript_117840/g.334091 Transcript_117840/m.334091 type:complete len:1611 (-) Transcript_117840:149-4981(-)